MFKLEDLDQLAPIYADPAVMRWTSAGLPMSKAQVEIAITRHIEAFREHGFGVFAVELKSSGTLVGQCGLFRRDGMPEVEIAYLLAQPCWGQGYATEATRAVRDFGFDVIGLDRIVGVTRQDNEASQNVLKKIGLRFEGERQYSDMQVNYFALNKADHEEHR